MSSISPAKNQLLSFPLGASARGDLRLALSRSITAFAMKRGQTELCSNVCDEPNLLCWRRSKVGHRFYAHFLLDGGRI